MVAALLLFGQALTASAETLHEWSFDERAGTRLSHTDNSRQPFVNWSVGWADSAVTGEGTFRIQRNGGTQNSRFDIGETVGANHLHLMVEIAGWDFSHTSGSNPLIRFSFMNGPADDLPSEITAEAVLSATNAGNVSLQARALGSGGTSSSTANLFPLVQTEPLVLLVSYSEALNRYSVHYRNGLGPWTLFYQGTTSAQRAAPSIRLLVGGDFNGDGKNFFDLERVALTSVAPVISPPNTVTMNSLRTEAGTTWSLEGAHLEIGTGNDLVGNLHLIDEGELRDLSQLSLGVGGGEGLITIRDPSSVLVAEEAPVIVGKNGSGSISVLDGGLFQSGRLILADETAAIGSLLVDGHSSRWDGMGADVFVGRQTGATGTINIRGGATGEGARKIFLGQHGEAQLDVTDGGALITENSVYVGYGSGGSAHMRIIGPTSVAEVGENLLIGASRALVPAGATAVVRVSEEAGMQVGGRVGIRQGGTLFIESGGTVVAGGGLEMGAAEEGGVLVIHEGTLSLGGPLDVNGATNVVWDQGTILAEDLVTGLRFVPAQSTLRLAGPDAFLRDEFGEAIVLGSGAAIEGRGTITQTVDLGEDGTGAVRGEPGGMLRLVGSVTGAGLVENVRVNGTVAPGSSESGIELRDVSFADGSTIVMEIREGAPHPKVAFAGTDTSNVRLAVQFVDFLPDPEANFELLQVLDGPDSLLLFQGVSLPAGWELDQWTLFYTGAPSVETWQEWTQAHSLTGDNAEPGADPDGDGFNNWMEFAFGGSPLGSSGALLRAARGSETPVLQWRQRLAGDLAYQIESSPDLMEWAPEHEWAQVPAVSATLGTPAGYQWMEVQVPVEADRSFYRVRAGEVPEQPIYPGETWEYVEDPEAEGVPLETIAECLQFLSSLDTTGFMAVKGGRVLFDYGDLSFISYSASVRKSILSMLFGKYVASGEVVLTDSLGWMGIDDNLGLLPIERVATVHDLLRARSGVYHPRSNSGDNWDQAPPRGSQIPGNYYLYNNWDFNALGTIFTLKTGKTPYEALETDFARPLQMEDYAVEGQSWGGNKSISMHLAYYFYLSTRDMARLGYLMLRNGKWAGEEIIPEFWVERSLFPWTPSHQMNPASRRSQGLSYSYLWWLREVDEESPYYGSYAAHGAGGQYIMVIPRLDLVLAHKTNSSGTNLSVSRSQFYALADILVSEMVESAAQ